VDAVQDFVESRQCVLQLVVRGVVLLTRGHLRQLVLHIGEHLTHCEENSTGQLFLVVQHEPLGERGLDLGLEDLRAWKLTEGLLFED